MLILLHFRGNEALSCATQCMVLLLKFQFNHGRIKRGLQHLSILIKIKTFFKKLDHTLFILLSKYY